MSSLPDGVYDKLDKLDIGFVRFAFCSSAAIQSVFPNRRPVQTVRNLCIRTQWISICAACGVYSITSQRDEVWPSCHSPPAAAIFSPASQMSNTSGTGTRLRDSSQVEPVHT